MTLAKLDNLVKIRQLKTEPPDQAEYEGQLDITPQLLRELIAITQELLQIVETFAPISKNIAH